MKIKKFKIFLFCFGQFYLDVVLSTFDLCISGLIWRDKENLLAWNRGGSENDSSFSVR